MSETLGGVGGIPVTIHSSAQQLSPPMVNVYEALSGAVVANFNRNGLDNGHVRSSKAEVFRSAHVALRRAESGEERNALVLGAGLLNDTPIEAIAESFDRVDVVDVNTDLTEQALSSLSAPLLGKISLIRAEVTGAMQPLYAAIEAAQLEPTYERFMGRAASLIRPLDVLGSQADFGKYSFVCSQMLLSQLVAAPFMSFALSTERQYGRGLATSDLELGSDALSLVLDEQGQKIEAGHISYLRKQVKRNGTVHFADTVGIIREGYVESIVYRGLGTAIKDNFDEIRSRREWRYTPGIGSEFKVVSRSLSPKQRTA